MDKSERRELEGFSIWSSLVAYGYVALWIFLSATVILYNKWVLSIHGFGYPVTLTMFHMFFCSVLAWVLILFGWVEAISLTFDTFIRAFMPIGLLYAGALWLGNAAYLYLSVSFIQMLKALMPVCVFVVGSIVGTETYSLSTLFHMLIISAGVATASYGEINFVLVGVIFQLGSLVTESIRLTMVQIILQKRNLKLNPITTLSYVAPCCCAFLLVPFVLLELPRLSKDPDVRFEPAIMLSNAFAAFALNVAVFLLIGKTSALSMNLAGVVKDWMLIGLSALLYHSPVTQLNIIGYTVAFAAVCWYNYRKIKGMQKAAERTSPKQGESSPLLSSKA
eukprot:jgi/Botrbrau1/23168/Bobra.0041s0019.1